ncbi:MAG TPA: glycosyltransferase family 1 protein [Isosphaeraceae bacterium]|nr:glycosyltransferase family 1 protein [Isosphaeraceae bacterium]
MTDRPPHIVLDPRGLDTLTQGGQFRYVLDLLRGLRDLGPALRITVFGGRPAPAPELAGLFTAGPDRWQYVYFPRLIGRGSMYREQAGLVAALVRAGADLYHGLHTVLPVWSPCPVVTTLYDTMYELFPDYAEAVRSRPYRLYRWAVRTRARRVICISRTTASDVHRLWGVPESRIDVVHLGTTFSDSGAQTSPVLEVPLAGPVIVSPYNLEPRKNLAVLVVAFSRLLPAVPAAKLVLYGRAAVTPEREAEFDRTVATAGVGPAIVRPGPLTDGQLGWLYRRATVFAFPSLYEGFGYPVLEGMAAGACVVARGTSAMAEVMGEAGAAVETRSVDELTATILGLLGDDDRRAALGRSAGARARGFTVQKMVEGTLRSYEQVLGRSIPAASSQARNQRLCD